MDWLKEIGLKVRPGHKFENIIKVWALITILPIIKNMIRKNNAAVFL